MYVTFVLHSNEQMTRESIDEAFSKNQKFFADRKIRDANALIEVLRWKLDLWQSFEHKKQDRNLVLTSGFTVNWVDRVFSGYAISCSANERFLDLLGSEESYGVAFLLGFCADDTLTDGNFEVLKGIARILAKCGFWPQDKIVDLDSDSDTAGVLTSDKRVVAYMRDATFNNVFYLYVRAVSVERWDVDVSKYQDIEMVKRVDGMIADIHAEFSEAISAPLDNNNKPLIIWKTAYNNLVRNSNTPWVFNNCYDHTKMSMPLVTYRPSDAMLCIYTDAPAHSNDDVIVSDIAQQYAIIKNVAASKCSGLGYQPLSTAALNIDAHATLVSEQNIMHRGRCFRYLGDVADPVPYPERKHIEYFESTLAYDKDDCPKARYLAKPVCVVVNTPTHRFQSMPYPEFIAFHQRIKSPKCAVANQNMGLLVYCLFRLHKNGKTMSNVDHSRAGFLVFNIADLVFSLENTERVEILENVSSMITFAMNNESNDAKGIADIRHKLSLLQLL